MQKSVFPTPVIIAFMALAIVGSCTKVKHTTANNNSACANACTGTVTDVDGNVYCTVQVGTQVWMAQNLRTAHFRNGFPITEMEDSTIWLSTYGATSNPTAWCYYNGNVAYNDSFGKLYNWYVVNDTNQLCPVGWHVPDTSDWSILFNSVGGTLVAGEHMKTTTDWSAPNTSADNSSCMSLLPTGSRFWNAQFAAIDSSEVFWATTPYGSTEAYCEIFAYNLQSTYKGPNLNTNGFSVRCVKDTI